MIVLMSDNSENAAVGHGGERDMARDIEASSIASHIDLFFDELHRIDVAYSDYARRAGVSDNVMCILDYLKDHDGASQRAIASTRCCRGRRSTMSSHRLWRMGSWSLGTPKAIVGSKRSVSRLPGADIATA